MFYQSGSPRPPFDGLVQMLVSLRNYNDTHQRSPAIVSVDIPSGWHVEEGDIGGEGIKPDMMETVTVFSHCFGRFHF